MLNYKQLVEQLKNGSTESAYALFLATFKQVYYTALKKTKNDVRTKYVVRDAYIQSIKNIGRLQYPDQFPVWTQQIANTAADNYLSKRKSFTQLHSNAVSDGPWSQEECDSLNISESFANEIWAQIVHGINGDPLEPALRSDFQEVFPAVNPAPGISSGDVPDGAEWQVNSEQLENILAGMSMLKTKTKKRAALMVAAAIIVLAIITGILSYSYNKNRRTRRYSALSNIYSTPAEEKAHEIASTISRELAGQIGEIYEMSDNTYYVVIYLNNEAAGGAMVSFIETNEGSSYKVISQTDKNLSSDEVAELAKDPYLRVDYSASNRKSNAIEDAVNAASEAEFDVFGNSLSLGKDQLAETAGKAADEKEKLSGIFDLDEENINVMLTVKCRHVDLTKPVRITIDSSVAEMLGDFGSLQIVLNDNRHCMRFSSEQVRELCAQYGSVTINVQAENNRIYNIKFTGIDGNETEELFGDVIFVLPADTELSYVYANYGGGRTYAEGGENRGGSFDPVEQTISFPVSHTGRYEIMGTKTELFDVDDLSEEMREACEFAASMQFIPAGDDGNFRPYNYMTRGEFIEALGMMFFTTDKTQQAGFTDITRADEIYDFVAAGFAGEVINGRADGSFGADIIISVEELLTMAGKTMILKAGDDERLAGMDGALNSPEIELSYSDKDEISGYAEDPVRILIAMDVISAEGKLGPKMPASRSYAALVLQRMYSQVFEK